LQNHRFQVRTWSDEQVAAHRVAIQQAADKHTAELLEATRAHSKRMSELQAAQNGEFQQSQSSATVLAELSASKNEMAKKDAELSSVRVQLVEAQHRIVELMSKANDAESQSAQLSTKLDEADAQVQSLKSALLEAQAAAATAIKSAAAAAAVSVAPAAAVAKIDAPASPVTARSTVTFSQAQTQAVEDSMDNLSDLSEQLTELPTMIADEPPVRVRGAPSASSQAGSSSLHGLWAHIQFEKQLLGEARVHLMHRKRAIRERQRSLQQAQVCIQFCSAVVLHVSFFNFVCVFYPVRMNGVHVDVFLTRRKTSRTVIALPCWPN
jgi:myosin heavy subunit